MNIQEVLFDRNKLWGAELTVSGTLRIFYNSSKTPPEGYAWMVSDPEHPTDFKESILVDGPNLVRAIIKVTGIWFGRHMLNHPAEIIGMLRESSDPRFSAMMGNVTRIIIDVDGEKKEVDVSDNE